MKFIILNNKNSSNKITLRFFLSTMEEIEGSNQEIQTLQSGVVLSSNETSSSQFHELEELIDDDACRQEEPLSTPRISNDSFIPPCSPEFKPIEGQIFATLEDGLDFYRAYAKHSGFSMRLNTTTRAKRTGLIMTRWCVCSKEGFAVPRKGTGQRVRLVTRVGCKALIAFKLTKNGAYKVFKFIEPHNHPLFSPSSIPFMKQSRNMSIGQKAYVVANSRMNIGPTKSFRLWKEQVGSYLMVGAALDDFKNFYRDLRAFIKDRDSQMFIENLYRKQEVCKSFFFDYEVNDDGVLTHALWADPVCKKNYALFGDTVSYDPTYNTNTYRLVFTPFTGVDHHKKCITFAAAFIPCEEEESFVWVFRTFLRAMDNQQPPCFITDQDLGIKNAFEVVFDKTKTRHRYCMWHITEKFSKYLPKALRNESVFLSKLNACVWNKEMEPDEFESNWKSLMREYDLEGHQWLIRMYKLREMWIPSYFRDTRMAGLLRTTSRSESQNKFFSYFVNRYLTLVEFWMRFESAMDAQRHKQDGLNCTSRNSTPPMKTPLALEKDAAAIYTHTIFFDFQEELCQACFSCGLDKIQMEIDAEIYTITNSPTAKKNEVVNYKSSNQDIKCSCKLFELFGTLCRHSLFVLKLKGVQKLPSRYVLDRWTKEATKKPMFDIDGNLLEDCAKMDEKKRLKGEVWAVVYDCVEYARNDVDELNDFLKKLREYEGYLKTKNLNNPQSKTQEMESILGYKAPTEVYIRNPNISSNKGTGKRIKSQKEIAIKNSKKKSRKCKTCGQYANHNSRTCSLLKANSTSLGSHSLGNQVNDRQDLRNQADGSQVVESQDAEASNSRRSSKKRVANLEIGSSQKRYPLRDRHIHTINSELRSSQDSE